MGSMPKEPEAFAEQVAKLIQRMQPGYRIDREERAQPFQSVDFYRQSLPVPMPRGGALLFNDSLYHGSDVNWSDEDRRSMTLGFVAHAAQDPDSIVVRGERQARSQAATIARLAASNAM